MTAFVSPLVSVNAVYDLRGSERRKQADNRSQKVIYCLLSNSAELRVTNISSYYYYYNCTDVIDREGVKLSLISFGHVLSLSRCHHSGARIFKFIVMIQLQERILRCSRF